MSTPGTGRAVMRICFAVVGVLVGVSAACVFGAVYHNVHTAAWALISGVVAAVTLFVHVTYLKRWYEDDPGPLRKLMYCGCFVQLAGVCAFVVYIVLAVTSKKGLVVYGEGYYVAAVWCFMTWKWGFLLFLYSRGYWRWIAGASLLLLPAEKATLAEKAYGS